MNYIPWWRVEYSSSDTDAVVNAIHSKHLSLGPITSEFENKISEILSVPYVVATTSGSMAILMALIVLGIGPGDEVIVPARTWIAAAHAVLMLGAKVILVDVKESIPVIDIEKIEAKISPKTKAIIPTSLNGRSVDIYSINNLASKYGFHVVEDAAQAFMSRMGDRYMGLDAKLSCFSLSMSKLISTGQGGFVVTKDKDLYLHLRSIRTHGVTDLFQCSFTRFGFNFRYTDLQASLGLAQLKKIQEKIVSLKRIYQHYEDGLKNFVKTKLIPVAIHQGELPIQIEVTCEDRDRLIKFLQEKSVQTKAFYPNLNRAKHVACNEEFKNSNFFESRGIFLPSGPDQSLEDIDRVINLIKIFEKK